MIVSLPMYDFDPPGKSDWDRLWQDTGNILRDHGIPAPMTLTRGPDPWHDWTSPDLLLSQTCGLPFRAKLHDQLSLVGAPVWCGPEQMTPGRYHSVVVAKKDNPRADLQDFDGSKLAYNDPLSQSGWGLMMQLCADQGIRPGSGLLTGSHRASAHAVMKGQAEFAAIDAVTWYHLRARDRWTNDLRIIARTADSPALPYVTAQPDLVPVLFDALLDSLSPVEDDDIILQRMFFDAPGIVPAQLEDYMAIPIPPTPTEIWGHRSDEGF